VGDKEADMLGRPTPVLAVLLLIGAVAQGYQWANRYDGPGHGPDDACAIGLWHGAPYVAGSQTDTAGESWLAVLRYEPTIGVITDSMFYQGDPGYDAEAHALAVSENGGIYVAGVATTHDEKYQFVVVRCDSSLNYSWAYNEYVDDDGTEALAVTTRGDTAYATGSTLHEYAENDVQQCLTVKVKPDGTKLWASEYSYEGGGDDPEDCGNALAVDGSGNVFVAVTSLNDDGGTLEDIVTIKYGGTGDTLWTRRYDGPANGVDNAQAVLVDAAGNSYVSGSSAGSGSGFDFATVKYTSNGGTAWVARYDGTAHDNDLVAAMVRGKDGHVYVAGTSQRSGTGQDFVTIKYDYDAGDTLWVRAFDAGPADVAQAICLDTAGNVFVTGYSTSTGGNVNYATVKYSPDGESLGVWTYDGTGGPDEAAGVAVDSSDNIYVTGTSASASSDIVTVKYLQHFPHDVGVWKILSPGATAEYGDAVVPSAVLYASESTAAACTVRFTVGTFYDCTTAVYLAMGATDTVEFDTWYVRQAGTHTVCCSLLTSDDDPTNDTASSTVYVPAGWKEMVDAPMPLGASGDPIKDGGWLDYNQGNGLVYGAKGNKTYEFYAYNPTENHWYGRNDILEGREGKPPRKGCRGICDGDSFVYMTKGNNTVGFYRYDVALDSWKQLTDVPLGTKKKKVKGGTDLAFVKEVSGGDTTGYVYLLKGYKNEFYRYRPVGDSWSTLAPVPAATPKMNNGSFLVYDGVSKLYAHQATYNILYPYDLVTQTWSPSRPGMPLVGMMGKKKKSKDGGSGAWLEGAVYALKGGNTQEFWKYDPDSSSGTWAELETMPRYGSTGHVRKVMYGGDITSDGAALYALKGNRTRELWRYVPNGSGTPPGEDNSPPPGENEMLVASGPCTATPVFSHSGLFIAFTKAAATGHPQVFRALSSGGGVQQLTQLQQTSCCLSPAWYSDDSKLAFIVEPDTGASKIGVVSSMGGPVVYLASVTGDIEDFALSPSGNSLVFSRSDSGSGDFTQLWAFSFSGGGVSELTTSSCDHYQPHFASDTEIVLRLDPPDEPSQIGKLYLCHPYTLNPGACVWKETTLTSTEHEHSAPCVAGSAGPVFFEVDTGGFTGLGRVKLNGDSECVIAASNGYDFEMPTTGPKGETLYCLRSTDAGAAVCEVYADGSGYAVLTDDEVERETPHARQNSGSPACATYIRDESVYRTLGHGEEGGQGQVLGVLALQQMRPNPSTTGRVVILWQVPRLTSVSLKMYNTVGQLVKTLVEGETKPGRYVTAWDGTDRRGRRVASGVYFCALEADKTRLNRKVVLTAGE
jgi:hypothetical protein